MRNVRFRAPGAAQLLLVALLVGVAALGPLAAAVPIARADTDDSAFLTALNVKGIHFGSPEQAFIVGHEVCGELDSGRSPSQVASTVMSNSNLDGYHAGYFVGASIRAYCPKHSS